MVVASFIVASRYCSCCTDDNTSLKTMDIRSYLTGFVVGLANEIENGTGK
jgi:hypothetical protein